MKKYLITGLLIWIPLVITLWVLKFIVDALDQTLHLLPPEFRTENWLGFHVPGMGAVMTIVIVFLTGALTLRVQSSEEFIESLGRQTPLLLLLHKRVGHWVHTFRRDRIAR